MRRDHKKAKGLCGTNCHKMNNTGPFLAFLWLLIQWDCSTWCEWVLFVHCAWTSASTQQAGHAIVKRKQNTRKQRWSSDKNLHAVWRPAGCRFPNCGKVWLACLSPCGQLEVFFPRVLKMIQSFPAAKHFGAWETTTIFSYICQRTMAPAKSRFSQIRGTGTFFLGFVCSD